MLRKVAISLIVSLSSALAGGVHGAPIEGDAPPAAVAADEDPGTPLKSIIKTVARKTGKKFIIDAKVRGNVELVGQDVDSVTYGELLTILQMRGYAAVEGGGVLRVVPETIVRQTALPMMVGSTAYPDAQYVSAVIPVHKVAAATLVPVLRPLLPQQAHLAAVVCANALLMVDTYANIQRIESLIAALDTGDSYKDGKCNGASADSPTGK